MRSETTGLSILVFQYQHSIIRGIDAYLALVQDIAAAVKGSATLQGEPAGEVQPQTAQKVLETDRLPADDLVTKAG